MSSKRQFLANTLESIGLFNLLRKMKGPSLVVINYHRLFKDTLSTNFDEGVFGHSESQFLGQMKWLAENFEIIDEMTLLKRIQEGVSLKSRTALITFDDGYRDNYEIAYPILCELKIPAIYFVSCNHIGGNQLPWWDQIAFMIKQSKESNLSFLDVNVKVDSVVSSEGVNEVLGIFKTYSSEKQKDSLTSLSKVTNVAQPQGEESDSQFMTWNQVQEVSQNGISIGSHSMNHDVLAQLPMEQQKWELEESKRVLESKIGKPIYSLAYPVGGVSAFTDETMKLTREAGYQLGFSFIQGYYKTLDFNTFQIHRVKLDQNPSIYKAQTLLPKVFLKAS